MQFCTILEDFKIITIDFAGDDCLYWYHSGWDSGKKNKFRILFIFPILLCSAIDDE